MASAYRTRLVPRLKKALRVPTPADRGPGRELGREEAALAGSAGWDGPGRRPHDTASPVRYAKDITAPVLLLHSENDTNVPVAQATYLHRALRVHGVPHELVVYPGEGHALTGRTAREDSMRRTRDFLLRHAA